MLAKKPNLRILESRERRRSNPGERDFRRVLGGVLVQDYDSESEDRDMMTVVTQRTPTEREWGDLIFAWRVAKHVGSNAIVIAQGPRHRRHRRGPDEPRRRGPDRACQGASSPSRARRWRRTRSSRSTTARCWRSRPACASFIQPGGAKRDDDVISAVDRHGVLDGLHRAPALPPLIRATETDADVDRWLAIRNEVFPSIAMSRSALDVQDRRGPEGRVKLLADDAGFAIVTPPRHRATRTRG